MSLIFIGAAKTTGGGKGRGRGTRKVDEPPRVVPFVRGPGPGERECIDQVARDLACSSLVMWGNLVRVIIGMLDEAKVSRATLREILDRLDDTNIATLPGEERDIAMGFVQAIREGLAAND